MPEMPDPDQEDSQAAAADHLDLARHDSISGDHTAVQNVGTESWYNLLALGIGNFGLSCGVWAFVFLRDIYVLKLGADLHIISIVSVIVYFWGSIADTIAGWLQDRCIFPCSQRYGPIAPWVLSHFILLTVIVLLAYCVPNNVGRVYLEVWYTVVSLVAVWCSSTLFVSYYKGLCTLFPFKEDRARVHSVSMIVSLPGVFIGVTIYAILLVNSSFISRLGMSVIGAIFILLGLCVALPMYLKVSIPKPETSGGGSTAESTWTVLRGFFSGDALRMLGLKSFNDGLAGGMLALFSFYLTYVSEASLRARSLYVMAALVGTLTIYAVVAYMCKRFFESNGAGDFHRLQMVATGIVFARAVLFAGGCASTKNPMVFIAVFVIAQGVQACNDFWGALALTFVIDEVKINAVAGSPSREGRYIGINNSLYGFGVAISSSVAILGMDWSGLDVADCSKYDDDDDILEDCYNADQDAQPAGAVLYLRIIFFVVTPFLLLTLGAIIYMFPITTKRLHNLEASKGRKTSADGTNVRSAASVKAASNHATIELDDLSKGPSASGE